MVVAVAAIGATVVHATLYDPQAELPVAVAAATTTPVSAADYPARLIIPALGINAAVQDAGIVAGGRMAAPTNFTDVAWYKYGTVPGQEGSAVIAGHLDNGLALKGVFKYLSKLTPGDEVDVVTEGGQTLAFTVSALNVYPYTQVPSSLFTESGAAYLNLITCDGTLLQVPGLGYTYDHRLVVTTILKSDS